VPRTKVIFYCEADGAAPVLDWLRSLPAKAQDKCVVRIERLAELGHELRRPEVDLRFTSCGSGSRARTIASSTSSTARPRRCSRMASSKNAPCLRLESTTRSSAGTGSRPILKPTPMLVKEVAMAKVRTTDALNILHREFYEGRPERQAALDEARAHDHVARMIRALREEAGLSQRALADRVGTTASVICRLEDAEYEGHSLAMLNRIAAALNRRVVIQFAPVEVEPVA
jgi:ribosome-binding protein aMBF1 (putative translation factor)